ncbi:polysaccharide biosynthesis/export family protein [Brevirhabdus sp.]|uniref:polysaccharide biosynthesis/export family protein n=1 Tax=Brevirhabdus sp. TaxID=2004514 RepID=UPI004059221E
MFKRFLPGIVMLALAGCGAAYITPSVSEGYASGAKVRVVPVTPESVLVANRSTYRPETLPAVFFRNAGAGGSLRGLGGPTPSPASLPERRPGNLELRVPPAPPVMPYQIGIGDVVLLATRSAGSTVEQLSGLLAAQNSRQGYTVQDDGAIAIPDVGRIRVAGMTLEEAEAEVFQKLVEAQIDPSFSLEIAEFNSKRVSIGGAVRNPTVVPIRLTPLLLTEALAAAGGVAVPDNDFAVIRIYRDGALYQIPVAQLYQRKDLQKIRLAEGDSIFVDTDFDLSRAQAYFAEQIQLLGFRQSQRVQALAELQAAVGLRRAALSEARDNFQARVTLDAVKRDYVYLSGEVTKQSRFALPFGRTATLADALYGEGGFATETGNPGQIYILRGSPDPADFGAVTAWQLNARNAASNVLATRMELRPNDVIFIAEQPITKWNRVVQQIVPSLITTGVGAVSK